MTDPREKAKRLRYLAIVSNDGNIRYAAIDAADLIEALVSERDRLREALTLLDNLLKSHGFDHTGTMRATIRAAFREGDET